MSRQRSRSPHYRSSPPRHDRAGSHSRRPQHWNIDDYGESHMGPAETDETRFERNRHPRDDAGEHWNYFREETRHATKKRTPPSLLWLPTVNPRAHPEEYGRRTPPSQPREQQGFVERRRLSPKQPYYRHEGGDRGRGDLRAFENDERQHQPHQKVPRERFVPNPTAPSHHHHHQQQREPAINLARENRGRSRDSSARSTSLDRGQREGRKDPQAPYKERRRAEPHHERSPALSNRHRREMDEALNHGYGKEEAFSSPEKPRDGFGGGDREFRGPQKAFSHREDRRARPVVIEHDHGIINSGSSQWEPRDQDFDGDGRSLQKGSLHEQFRRMNRSNAREELRHHRPAHDDNGEPVRVNRANPREELGYRPLRDDGADPGHERSRSPVLRDRDSPTGFPDGGGSSNYGDASPPNRGRGRMNPSWGRRMGAGPPRNHPPVHHPPQDRPGPSQQPQRRENHSAGVGDFYIGSREEDPGWTEEDMEPKMPRGREHKWNTQQTSKEMTVVTEETLTIKVDMSRPVNQNSQQCYSSDRQLSLDLVNVGRQRLDFLPMLEHSGTYRESSMHTGTFAQEIITLVHQVKELYFGGYGTTLTERFGLLKEGSPAEKEYPVEEHLTLNRRFNMNKTALPEDDEPLFPRLGDMHDDSLFSRLGEPPRQQQQQMLRDPGDLRYDLDRRRQERLEGVKVTIPGGGPKQQPLGVRSDQNAEYDEQESNERGERSGLSAWSADEQLEQSWSEEEPQEESWSGEVQPPGRWSGQGQPQRRWRGNMGPRRGAPNRQNSPQGPRRGAPHRQNSGPQRRTHRPGNRPGQMRWQNNRNNVQTGDWTT